MDTRTFKSLLDKELITETEFEKIRSRQYEPVSVHWDLRTLLYLGIVLLTTAFGILVYKNIDTIGHDVIIIVIAVLCALCFWYSFKNSKGYSINKIASPNVWFDYILLSGCLLLLTFVGYLQFEYQVFGNRWGLAAFIPMVLLFMAAYYFDHLGVLSLAVTNLAAWLGISVTPLQVLKENDFNNSHFIFSGLVLGIFLLTLSFASVYKNIKAHFYFTYKNFGSNILLIAELAAIFSFQKTFLLWFLFLAITCFFLIKNAINENSFYFLVITILYAYTGLSYVIISLLFMASDDAGSFYISIIYFILSGIGLIRFFIHYNKKLRLHDGI